MTEPLPDPAVDRMPSGQEMLQALLVSARRVIAIARQVGEQRADVRVPACPAWSVRNLLAHVTSVAKLTALDLPWGDDPQVTIDREVAERASTPMVEIADEWDAVLPILEDKLAGNGPVPLVVDLVTHEHDLRAALGPDFRDHSAGLPEALSAMVQWVRYMDMVGNPGILLKTPTSQAVLGGPEIGCEVELPDDWELLRVLGVRRSKEQLRAYPQKGDQAILFAATGRYPHPEVPLEPEG